MRAGALVGDVKEPADGGAIAEELLARLPCGPIDVDHDDFGVVIDVDEKASVAADDVERRLKEGVKFFVAIGRGVSLSLTTADGSMVCSLSWACRATQGRFVPVRLPY